MELLKLLYGDGVWVDFCKAPSIPMFYCIFNNKFYWVDFCSLDIPMESIFCTWSHRLWQYFPHKIPSDRFYKKTVIFAKCI